MVLPNFKNKAFLAPMAGISDPAFRLLCSKMGASLVVTELISVHSIVAKEKEFRDNNKKIYEFIEFSRDERPVSIQLFGQDVDLICKAAKIVEPYFDIIDFNMGCPAPHITAQMAGAALLQEPSHVRKIFRSLVNSVNKPVTLKIRAGVNEKTSDLWKEIVKIAQEEGISMIAFHPRTIKQGYSGNADWNKIKELKKSVKIPVIGNGDITCPQDAKKMIEKTGCDYVMVGRGAMGNPFIFKQINDYLATGKYEETTSEMKIKAFLEYIKLTKQYKTIKFSDIRIQAMKFTKGMDGAPKLREKIGKTKNSEELKEIFNEKI